jgi:hypothetical protein
MTAIPPFAAPPPWTNQRIVLYHGTVSVYVASICRGIDPSFGRANADFGLGFYTTTVERQARAWAWQIARRRSRISHGHAPVLIRFDVQRDALARLDGLWFVRGSFDAEDYWSLVQHCRTTGGPHGRQSNDGWYDVVVGPIAASWAQRLTMFDVDQISFHTPAAAAVLDASNPTVIP